MGDKTRTSAPQPSADHPYGTEPRRSRMPLVTLIAAFAAWFAFLLWMALQYPAR